jgi:Zn-dependent protease with chaperone function
MTAVVALVAFALCWLTLSIGVAAVYRAGAAVLSRLHPRARAALLLALSVLPLAVALLVVVLGFAPLVGGWVVAEHCHAGSGCATHVPALHADALYALLLGSTAVAAVGALLFSIGRRLHKSLLVASSLRFLAERAERRPYEIIESGESFAYCIGFLRPHIVLSRGLVERMPQMQLEVVLHHEQAHAARRDNLRSWLAGLALLPCPRRLKAPLLGDLALAAEQACDRAAAAKGGPEVVVETLRALAGAPARHTSSRAAFESRTTLGSRIDAVRNTALRHPPPAVLIGAAVASYLALAILATDLVHHGAEWVLSFVG